MGFDISKSMFSIFFERPMVPAYCWPSLDGDFLLSFDEESSPENSETVDFESSPENSETVDFFYSSSSFSRRDLVLFGFTRSYRDLNCVEVFSPRFLFPNLNYFERFVDENGVFRRYLEHSRLHGSSALGRVYGDGWRLLE